jgi:signal transduction histidine kinase
LQERSFSAWRRDARRRALKIKTKLEPDNVLIEIRDKRAGIPVEAQPHIFEPFYTTKGIKRRKRISTRRGFAHRSQTSREYSI